MHFVNTERASETETQPELARWASENQPNNKETPFAFS